ncbi:hypothetical protein JCM14469_21700 [Desulfatiferula olefinivorans]
MKRLMREAAPLVLIALAGLASGCALTTRLMVDMSSPVVTQMNESFNRNCDIGIMAESMPFSLAGISGLIDISPDNDAFLLNGAHAYFGYAFAFVEDSDEPRASRMYRISRDYGLRSLFADGTSVLSEPLDAFERRIGTIRKKKVPALFWTTIAWLSYIRLNLDDVRVYLDVPKAEAMARRLLELDETYFFASPCLVMACYYSAQPEIAGGDPVKARAYFERAIDLSGGRFLMHHLFFAKFYAVRKQDRELYLSLLQHILDQPEDILPDHCAVTNVCKMKAGELVNHVDDFF